MQTEISYLHSVKHTANLMVEITGEDRLKGHWLMIDSGCICSCLFCEIRKYTHMMFAGCQNIIARSPEHEVNDLERLKQLGNQRVSFNLDPAVLDMEYWTRLFTELRRRAFQIGLYIEFLQHPSIEFVEEMFPLLDILHSELAFLPLPVSKGVRRLNGKHFNNTQLVNMLRQLRLSGIAAFIHFSLNAPFEVGKIFQHTLYVAGEIRKFYLSDRLPMINMLHTVDPCGSMTMQAKSFNLKGDIKRVKDYYACCQQPPILRHEVELSDWSEYRSPVSSTATLAGMAAQWDKFYTHQPSRYYPVLRTWQVGND